MPSGLVTRVQVALVVHLFLGSLSALLFNTVAALGLSGREPEGRARLWEAGRRMVEGAAPVADAGGDAVTFAADPTGRYMAVPGVRPQVAGTDFC